MIPAQTLAWGQSRSCIRELAEFGARRKAEIGKENVFDFSLGNPSIPAPAIVNETIAELLCGDSVALHGYTTAAGAMSLREKIAEDLNDRFGLSIAADKIYVTCGAAASLTITFRAILMPEDEVVVPAPFFTEYRVFVQASGGKIVPVDPAEGMQPDLDGIRKAIGPRTKAVLINSPNNPSGVVYTKENIIGLAELMKEKEEEYGHPIYLIADEPYREIVYGDAEFTEPLCYYADSILCYSWSKSLSVPGERIGYIALNAGMADIDMIYAAVLGAGRALGYVNPPSLMQKVIEKSIGYTADMSKYQENRDTLCKGLSEIGYEFAKPDGAFYLFVRALEPDAQAFSNRAKAHELLLVPSDDFGVPGYIRIAYCVSKEMIERSMPAFRALYEEYHA